MSLVDGQMIDRFATDGAVVLRGAITEWIEPLRDSMDELLDGGYDPSLRLPGAMAKESQVLQTSGKWAESETFRRFLSESPIAQASAELMGSQTARLFEDLVQLRPPGDGVPSWHRDMPYWPITGRQATNVWFTLEGVTPYNGSIHVIAGSHRDSREAIGDRLQPTPSDLVLAFGCEPGDVIIFHPWALHTGFGSWPDQPRRTFTIRFLGDDIRWRPAKGYYHQWMGETGLGEGDTLDHAGFPMLWPPSTVE